MCTTHFTEHGKHILIFLFDSEKWFYVHSSPFVANHEYNCSFLYMCIRKIKSHLYMCISILDNIIFIQVKCVFKHQNLKTFGLELNKYD